MNRSTLYFILLAFLGAACDIKDNDVAPTESFFRIYDDNQFDASFIALDVVEKSDGEFLILSGTRQESSDFVGVNIIQADDDGTFIRQNTLPPNFVHPVANWLVLDSTYYFFCMDATSLQTQLFSVDNTGDISGPTAVGLTMPQHSTLDVDEFILSSYDNESRSTVLSTVLPDGTITASAAYSIGDGEGVEEPVIDHYTRTGRQLPFFVGRLGDGTYFFNGFYNFTLSLVFTDLGDPLGVVQGQQENGGISAIQPLSGQLFATARFNFGDNFVIPNATINTTGVSSAIDLGGNPMLEFTPDAPVYIERLTLDERPVLVYASTTKNGQVILLLYDETDGSWLGTDYLGFSNPFEARAIHQTADGGLVVLAQTSIVGRFPRTSLFKLSTKELERMIVAN